MASRRVRALAVHLREHMSTSSTAAAEAAVDIEALSLANVTKELERRDIAPETPLLSLDDGWSRLASVVDDGWEKQLRLPAPEYVHLARVRYRAANSQTQGPAALTAAGRAPAAPGPAPALASCRAPRPAGPKGPWRFHRISPHSPLNLSACNL